MVGSNIFPGEVIGRQPLFTLSGMKHLQVEQHCGIMLFQQDRMVFKTAVGCFTVTGENLQFLSYSAQEATLCGRITGLFCTPSGGEE